MSVHLNATALAVAAVFVAAASVVQAANVPQSTRHDQRITRTPYNPDDVVVLGAAEGVLSRIVLEPGEQLLPTDRGGVLVAFPGGWEVQPFGDMVAVRPIAAIDADGVMRDPEPKDWATNLALRTNRGRLYDVELRLIEPGTGSGVPYRIEFTYPDDEAENTLAQQQAESDRRHAAAAPVIDDDCAIPGLANDAYRQASDPKSRGIVPHLAADDGRFTYLYFRGEIPAIFIRNVDGTESTTNPRPDPDCRGLQIVDRVAPGFVLRLGDAVVLVENEGDVYPVPPPLATPDLIEEPRR